MTFRFSHVAAAVALAAVTLAGCSFNINTDEDGGDSLSLDELQGKSFTRITAAGPDDVVVVAGPETSVTASGDSDAIKQLRFAISGDELRISRKNRSGWQWGDDDGKVVITVTLAQLSALTSAGSGDASIAELSGDAGQVTIAGSGNITVAKTSAKTFTAKVAGSGNITLTGSADVADFSIAGSGNVQASDFTTPKASVSIAGSGSADFASDGEVSANIVGSGNVRVRGSAKCTSKVVGSGTIRCG